MEVLRDIQLGRGISIGDGKILFLSIDGRGTITVKIDIGSEIEIRRLNQEEAQRVLKEGKIRRTNLDRGQGIVLGKERDLNAGCPFAEIHIIKSEGCSQIGIITDEAICIRETKPILSTTASS